VLSTSYRSQVNEIEFCHSYYGSASLPHLAQRRCPGRIQHQARRHGRHPTALAGGSGPRTYANHLGLPETIADLVDQYAGWMHGDLLALLYRMMLIPAVHCSNPGVWSIARWIDDLFSLPLFSCETHRPVERQYRNRDGALISWVIENSRFYLDCDLTAPYTW
jgi:hypothetical protein